MLAPRQEETTRFDASSVASQQNMRERLAPESSSHAFASVNKPVSNTNTMFGVPSLPMNGPKQEKVRGSSTNSLEDVRVADGLLAKKKVKRKTELELEGTQFRPEKLASLPGEERLKSQKQSASVPLKSNLQPTSLPGLEQSS